AWGRWGGPACAAAGNPAGARCWRDSPSASTAAWTRARWAPRRISTAPWRTGTADQPCFRRIVRNLHMEKTLAGEIVLVTGASRGIGAAIADELAAQGATVIGTATSEGGAKAIGERMAAAGGHGRVLNVTDPGSIDALLDSIADEFGPVSVLVNNAGITRDNLLMRMKDEDWQAIIDTNLTSIFRTSKAVMRPMMKARRGRIINIASVIGLIGNAGQANYAA